MTLKVFQTKETLQGKIILWILEFSIVGHLHFEIFSHCSENVIIVDKFGVFLKISLLASNIFYFNFKILELKSCQTKAEHHSLMVTVCYLGKTVIGIENDGKKEEYALSKQ